MNRYMDRVWLKDVGFSVLILAGLSVLAGVRPLLLPDEGRYVGVAWEMVRSGDWLTPTLNGLPYFHKPPLFYWVTAVFMSLFGTGELTARAAPLLGAWILATAVFLFVRRWWGRHVATLAMMALLSQPLFYLGGQYANLDMLVAGCISATVLLLVHAILCFERSLPWRCALFWAYVFAALGVLSKGLIGFVLPALSVGVWLVLRRRWSSMRALFWWPALAAFALISVPWFAAMQARFPDFLDYFFVEQHFRRFAAGGFNNVQPFWFYPAILLLAWLPWMVWLRPLFDKGYFTDQTRGDLRVLMVLWAGVVVLFFSLPQSKLVGYIFPAIAPLAILLADGFQTRSATKSQLSRWWRLGCGIGMAVSLAVIAFFAITKPKSNRELGMVLRSQYAPHEAVYMLGNHYFDLSTYAHLQEPAKVVLDWSNPSIRQRDGWQKELADAAVFKQDLAQTILLQPEALTASLCKGGRSWLIGPSAANADSPFLDSATVVATNGPTTLWLIDARTSQASVALNCLQRPSGG